MIDPYFELNDILDQAMTLNLQHVEKKKKMCFCFGISSEQFEEITSLNSYPNKDIKFICKSNFVTIKKIGSGRKEFYICNFPDIFEDAEYASKINNISRLQLFQILQQKSPKVHALVNNRKCINPSNQIRECWEKGTLTEITISQQYLKEIEFGKFQKKYDLLRHIESGKYSNKIEPYFETSSVKYIQEQVYQFLQNLYVPNQLETFQTNLDICSQFPKFSDNFLQTFQNYMKGLESICPSENDQDFFQYFLQIVTTIQQNSYQLNSLISSRGLQDDEELKKFCEILGTKLKNIQFSFVLDLTKLKETYTKSQNFESFYKIKLDWKWQEIVMVKDLINYISQYIHQEKKYDLEYMLKKQQQLNNIQCDNGAFLIGLTKAGKSTVASILEDSENVEIVDYEYEQSKYSKKQNQTILSINNDPFSNSQRDVEYLKLDNQVIFDCPGLNDTGEDFRVTNAYNIFSHLKQVQKIAFIIVIESKDKMSLLQNFKQTIECLNTFKSDFLLQQNLLPIFVLTKMQKVNYNPNQNKYQTFVDTFQQEINDEKFINKLQQSKIEKEFRKFLQAQEDNRVLYFPSIGLQQQSLEEFRNQLLLTTENIYKKQQNISTNFFELELNEKFERETKEFQNSLQEKVDKTFIFLTQKLQLSMLQRIQFDPEIARQSLTKLIGILEKEKESSDYKQLFINMIQFGIENKYFISNSIQQRVNVLVKVQLINQNHFPECFQTQLDFQKQQLEAINQLISQSQKDLTDALYWNAVPIIGFVVYYIFLQKKNKKDEYQSIMQKFQSYSETNKANYR